MGFSDEFECPSSSVMETTDIPMQTGFPASSHTSLSVASTRDGKDVGLSEEVDAVSPEEVPPTIPVSAEKTPVVLTTSTAPAPPFCLLSLFVRHRHPHPQL